MSNQRKTLGNAGEKGIVERALAAGLRAFRQPLSGQLKAFPADVVIETGSEWVLVESKVRSLLVRASGKRMWTIDFDWLRKVMREAQEQAFDHAALFVRPKGSQDRFVLLDEAIYLELLRRTFRP